MNRRMEMLRKVEQFIKKWNMLNREDEVILGVSGGADSVALLYIFLQLRSIWDLHLKVVHVHHGIRGEEADHDAGYVRELCDKLGVPCVVKQYDVRRIAKEKRLSEEEAGRVCRREAFEEVAGENGKIALAHQMEDQAETVLMHLARGSNLKGLGGIRPVNGRYLHPLLCVSRQELETYLQKMETEYCQDATNAEDAYTRNRIRHHILPALSEQVNRQTVKHIFEVSEELQQMEAYLEKQTDLLYAACVVQASDGILIQKEEFEKAPLLIQKRILFRAAESILGSSKNLEKQHIERLMELFGLQTGRRIELSDKVLARKTYEGICLSREQNVRESGILSLQLPEPGEELTAYYGEYQIVLRCFEWNPENAEKGWAIVPKKEYTKWFDYDIIKNGVVVRSRLKGDKIALFSDGRSKKLKEFFVNEKIPSTRRDEVMLIAEDNEILWAVGLRQSCKYQLSADTRRVLEIRIYGG